MRLQGKIALITGAGSGIGEASALLFAKEGAAVVAADLNGEAARATAERIAAEGGRASHVQGDVGDPDDARRIVEHAVAAFGRIDVLFNNAGIGHVGRVHETEIDDWDRVIRVHVRGTFLMCKYAIPHMIEAGGGVIINMSSVAGIVGVKNRAAYSASKAGVYGLTKAMAVDHAADGIRVNCICPGTVDSPWIGKIIAGQPDPDAVRKSMEARQLLGRMGTPEEIAHAALYLAQDESAFVHGTALIIDGGLTAQ